MLYGELKFADGVGHYQVGGELHVWQEGAGYVLNEHERESVKKYGWISPAGSNVVVMLDMGGVDRVAYYFGVDIRWAR